MVCVPLRRFSAASPIPGPVSLSEHALVANQQEGLLLALGGCLTSGDRRHRHSRMFDQVGLCCGTVRLQRASSSGGSSSKSGGSG